MTALSKNLAHQAQVSASHTAFLCHRRCEFYLSHLSAYFSDVTKWSMLSSPAVFVYSLFREEDVSRLLEATRSSSSLKSQQAMVDVASRRSSTSSSYRRSRGSPPRSPRRSPVQRRRPASASPSRASKRVRFDSPAPSSALSLLANRIFGTRGRVPRLPRWGVVYRRIGGFGSLWVQTLEWFRFCASVMSSCFILLPLSLRRRFPYRAIPHREGFTFQGCHRTRFIWSGLLQWPFCHPKGHWWLAAGYRLVIPQPVCSPVPFSYDAPIPPIWRLADFSRPPGACPPSVSEVSALLSQLPSVSVSGPLLWFIIHATCLHACHGPGLLYYASFWLPHSSVFGRLAGPWLLPVGDHSGEGLPFSTLFRPRHSDQPVQELSQPAQQLDYLGMTLQSTPLRAFPTQSRVHKVLCLVDEFSSSPEQPLSIWRSLLGVMSSLSTLIAGSRLQMRSLQHRLLVCRPRESPTELVSWDTSC